MSAGLERFVGAQTPMYEEAVAELASGRKIGHWMWFVFPQAISLGRSSTACFYGIASLAEASAYLDHPLLGRRLRHSTRVATEAPAASLIALFGSPDDLKFRSSMTLLAAVASDPGTFAEALLRWDLMPDPATLEKIEAARQGPDRL